jgi:hypothetical protein
MLINKMNEEEYVPSEENVRDLLKVCCEGVQALVKYLVHSG